MTEEGRHKAGSHHTTHSTENVERTTRSGSSYVKMTFSPGRPSERRTTACQNRRRQRPQKPNQEEMGDGGRTYLPLIFQPSSSLSRRSASSSPSGPRPTTTSLLMVRILQIFGAPAAEAMGPIAISNSVEGGAAQSYVN